MQAVPGLAKKVLIIESGKFLGGVVSSLIERQNLFDVVSFASDDCSEIIQEINRRAPDVVVVEDRAYRGFAGSLTECLEDFPNLKIVVLSSIENKVEVYSKNRIKITQAADFFAVL